MSYKLQSLCNKQDRNEVCKKSGAFTPYKRWSKCTMEKVGEAFLQKLRGKCINY